MEKTLKKLKPYSRFIVGNTGKVIHRNQEPVDKALAKLEKKETIVTTKDNEDTTFDDVLKPKDKVDLKSLRKKLKDMLKTLNKSKKVGDKLRAALVKKLIERMK